MFKDPITVILIGVLLWVYFSIVNIVAQNTVATECEKLGAFYVGDKVYECKLKGAK